MKLLSIIYLLFMLSFMVTSQASSLKSVVKKAVSVNSEIISNELKVKSAKKDIEKEQSALYPTLDFETSFEKTKIQNEKKDSTTKDPWEEKDGYIVSLKAEQVLYAGGKTISKIKEKKYEHLSTNFKFNQENEKIVFEIVQAYTKLVKYKELNQLTNYNDKAHEKALQIARENEKIGGTALETLKTLVLLSSQNDKKLEQKNKFDKAQSEYIKLTSSDRLDIACRPEIDNKVLPSNLEDILKLALENNYKIKEQKEIIKKQQEIIFQAKSGFKPNITLNLDASYDEDLELNENGNQTEYTSKVSLNWNFYSGGKDSVLTSKEKIALLEQKKNLEKISSEVVENVTNLFNTYKSTQDRIKNFNELHLVNQKILHITKDQLSDGTKTFLDLLQTKIKVINTQTDLIKQEFILIDTYYELLKELSIITKTILSSKDQVCQNNTIPNLIKDIPMTDADINNILNDSLADSLEEIFINKDIVFDKTNLTIELLISHNSFLNTRVNPNSDLYGLLDSFSKDFIATIMENKDNIKAVYIYYINSTSNLLEIEANKNLAHAQAYKVKKHFRDTISINNDDLKWFISNVYPVGEEYPDLTVNEDKKTSKKIIIQILEK